MRFLDDVIDQNQYPIPEIDEMTKRTRKIGLGVMGWADLLFELRIAYDSDEAIALAERVMVFIQDRADEASVELAESAAYSRRGKARFTTRPPATNAPARGTATPRARRWRRRER